VRDAPLWLLHARPAPCLATPASIYGRREGCVALSDVPSGLTRSDSARRLYRAPGPRLLVKAERSGGTRDLQPMRQEGDERKKHEKPG